MRYLNLQNGVLVSLLVAGVAAWTGCSSGSDAPNTTSGGAGTSSGTAGTSGGSSSGSAGDTTVAGAGGSGMAGAATGGTGGAGGGGNVQTGVCAGAGTRKLTIGDTKIDDFEAAMISPGWSSFNDVMPTPNSFKIAQEAPGAIGTAHFGHYMGTGAHTTATGGYGVGTVYNVAIDTVAKIYCIDITAFDGVSFWGKAATAASKVNVTFVLPETNQKDPVNGGGDCMKDPTCFNHPFKAVTLTTDWAPYSVKFSDAGGGKYPAGSADPGGAATVKTVIQELVWISLDKDWDFSIDEIQFYKGTAPTGPVGGGDAGQ